MLRNELVEHVNYWVEMDGLEGVEYDRSDNSDIENLKEHFSMKFDDLTDDELEECTNLYFEKMKELKTIPKTYDEFIKELTKESENLIEGGLGDYSGSEGIYKRAYEIYEEGWELSNKVKETKEYYSDVNQYIKDYFEK